MRIGMNGIFSYFVYSFCFVCSAPVRSIFIFSFLFSMKDFESLCTVLRRTGLSGLVSILPGPPSQMEIRNRRAMEIIRGMRKQKENKENKELLNCMRIEWEFLRSREIFIKTGKIKRSLLNRAVFLCRSSSDPSFVKFIEERAKSYIAYAENKKDGEHVNSMNEISGGLPVKSLRKALRVEIESTEEYFCEFQGMKLLFKEKEKRDAFLRGEYRKMIVEMKNSLDFDSRVVVAISRIEEFKIGMNKLLSRTDKKSLQTLERYMRQWVSLYAEALDLFSANFMDEEYLHRINREISQRFTPVSNSILFHPVTYDLASVYIYMPQEISSSSPAGISRMLSRMNLFRK